MRKELLEETKDDDRHVNLFKQEQLNQLQKEKQGRAREIEDERCLGKLVGHPSQKPWYLKAKQPDAVTKSLKLTNKPEEDQDGEEDRADSNSRHKDKKKKKSKKEHKAEKKEKKREIKRQLKDLKKQIEVQKEIER